MTKVETWITPKTKSLMAAFGARLGLTIKGTAELVLEATTPLYLGELNKKLDALVPLVTRIREYEHYGIKPNPVSAGPVRIVGVSGNVTLDPRDYHSLLEKVSPLVAQLQKSGVSAKSLSKLVPPKKRPTLPLLRHVRA